MAACLNVVCFQTLPRDEQKVRTLTGIGSLYAYELPAPRPIPTMSAEEEGAHRANTESVGLQEEGAHRVNKESVGLNDIQRGRLSS